MIPSLVQLLDLEPTGPDRFRGRCHEGVDPRRIFGGHVAAHSLLAATASVPAGRVPHSLHAYFLRAGDPVRPVDYEVDRVRDGGSYAVRRVSAWQGEDEIFALTASFKAPEDSALDRAIPRPDIADPEDLVDPFPAWAAASPADFERCHWNKVVEQRYVEVGGAAADGSVRYEMWLRAAHRLPDDPAVHAGVLTYLSDLNLAAAAGVDREQPRPLRRGPSLFKRASLDHALWFHRPFRADEWLLLVQRSPSAVDGRGFSTAEVFSREGHLVASVVQESMQRLPR